MLSPLKKSQSNKENIKRSLHETIYNKVTKKTHNHESPKKNGDGTLKKCIELFKEEADPNVLSELEKSLIERIELEESPKKEKYQKYYKYYIENFLLALETEVMGSEELAKLPVLNNERKQSQRPQTIRGKILGIISEITSKSSNKNLKTEEQPINSVKEEIPVLSIGMTKNNVGSLMTPDQTQRESDNLTKEEVCASGSDSGVSSREPSEESLESPINSRRSSISSALSFVGEDNNLQKEDENQMQPEQDVEEESKMQENENSGGQEGKTSSQVKGELKSNGKESEPALLAEEEPKLEEQKKEAVANKQEAPGNGNNNQVKKQPDGRNLHVAFAAGCALSTIGCIVAGAITSGLIGAGLFVMATVFAIAAAAEFHSNFLSSKLTSINVSPLVDDKELTTCSQR